MHVGQNFKEHRNDYNRDHFVHQIRNLYMMIILLGKYGFFEASYLLLQDSSGGKISEYTKIKLDQFVGEKYNAQYDLLKDLQSDIYESIETNIDFYKKELINSSSRSEQDGSARNIVEDAKKYQQRCSSEDDYVKSYFLKYVIYASTILSALFHDMGYPICHFLDIRHRVSDYNPTMYMFTNNTTETFDQIAAKLNDSLLFTIVSVDEIKKSLNLGENGRYNHGAYSAIAFLLQFYNNGVFYSLSPEKQCAIELAAVAIYNHTAQFDCIDKNGGKDNNYYQAVFRQNPISFLLRFCDDLQEWDRRYFEFSKDSDLSICRNCLVPLVPIRESNINEEDTNISQNADNLIYNCACDYNRVFRYDSFLKRKLYVVRVADDVSVGVINTTKNDQLLCFSINYDLYKLLKITRVNNTYAKFRLGDLNKLKKLIGKQNFAFQSDNILSFKYIYLDYFITSNPILIKIKILEKYLLKSIGKEYFTASDDYKNEIDEMNLESVSNDIFSGEDISNKKLYEYLNNKGPKKKSLFDFYKALLEKSLDVKHTSNGDYSKISNNLIEEYGYKNNSRIYDDALKLLVEDCLRQYSKEMTFEQINGCSFIKEKEDSKLYYSQYSPDDQSENALYNSVGVFCSSNNNFNIYSNVKDKHIPNYYTDLHFFYKMNEYIK